MADLRRPRIAKIPQVSAQWIKTAAAILLVAANAGAILVEKGIIGMDGYTMSELLTSMENSSGMTGLVGAAVLAVSERPTMLTRTYSVPFRSV